MTVNAKILEKKIETSITEALEYWKKHQGNENVKRRLKEALLEIERWENLPLEEFKD